MNGRAVENGETKHQISNHKLQTNSNYQCSKDPEPVFGAFEFVISDLFGI